MKRAGRRTTLQIRQERLAYLRKHWRRYAILAVFLMPFAAASMIFVGPMARAYFAGLYTAGEGAGVEKAPGCETLSSERSDILARGGEDLDDLPEFVADPDPAVIGDGDARGQREVSRSEVVPPPTAAVRPVRSEDLDGELGLSTRDHEIAVGQRGDGRDAAELSRGRARCAPCGDRGAGRAAGLPYAGCGRRALHDPRPTLLLASENALGCRPYPSTESKDQGQVAGIRHVTRCISLPLHGKRPYPGPSSQLGGG